jgi:hypothetical protein
VAGYDGRELFTPAALTLLAERSQGIPRNINNICFNALSLGCAMRRRRIGSEVVLEATADLAFDSFVQQPQAVPFVPPALPAMPQSSRSPIRTAWLRTRPFQTAALAVALAAVFDSLLIYSGTHVKAGTARPSAAISRVIPSAEGTLGGKPVSPHITPGTFSSVQPDSPAQTDRSQDFSASFTYVVQPDDTLREICLWTVGRYDAGLLSEVQKLNQGSIDLNHLVAGQQVRLPRLP